MVWLLHFCLQHGILHHAPQGKVNIDVSDALCLFLFQDEIGAHKSNTTLITSEEAAEEDGLQTFFNNPFLTFVKTCTMFVGELEFSDIPIDLDSNLMPLSYFYFLSFVILIVVVLMNLLNGLAVSDIREIRERAEIVAYLSIVDTVSPLSRIPSDP